MYNYSFNIDNGNVIIKTPKVDSFDDIKKELKSTSECIINHSIYPNGLEVIMTQLSDKIILSSNKKLINHNDGSYSFEE